MCGVADSVPCQQIQDMTKTGYKMSLVQEDVSSFILFGYFSTQHPWPVTKDLYWNILAYRSRYSGVGELFVPRVNWMPFRLNCLL